MRNLAQEISKEKLISKIRNLVGQYPMGSHALLASFMNKCGVKTTCGGEWSTKNLKGFMERNGIAHKTGLFSADQVISENRLESIRLV